MSRSMISVYVNDNSFYQIFGHKMLVSNNHPGRLDGPVGFDAMINFRMNVDPDPRSLYGPISFRADQSYGPLYDYMHEHGPRPLTDDTIQDLSLFNKYIRKFWRGKLTEEEICALYIHVMVIYSVADNMIHTIKYDNHEDPPTSGFAHHQLLPWSLVGKTFLMSQAVCISSCMPSRHASFGGSLPILVEFWMC